MTEAEWLDGNNPKPMLDYLHTVGSPRKTRLLGCGFCRLIWKRLEPEDSRRSVEIAEAYADGEVSKAKLRTAHRLAEKAAAEKPGSLVLLGFRAVAAWVAIPKFDAEVAANIARACRDDGDEHDHTLEFDDRGMPSIVSLTPKKWNDLKAETRQLGLQQAVVIRCVFGNPFRPVWFDPAWRTPDVAALAKAAYDERILPSGELDPHRLAVLADALEELAAVGVVAHLRGPGPHVRGCWAVDLCLGKA
jgi:hypothetical protein